MQEQAVTPEEVKAKFDSLKKERGWAILKQYEDGALKIIDDYGVMLTFDNGEEFMRYARRADVRR
jgi:hypothetical protein